MASLLKTEPLLSVTFETNPHDLVDTQYRISLAPTQVRERWKLIFMTTGATFLLLLFTNDGFDLLPRVFWAAIISTFVFITGATVYIWSNKGLRLRAQIEKNFSKRYLDGSDTADLVGKRELVFHEDGLSILTSSDFSETTWKTMTAICLLHDSILFFPRPTKFLEIPRAKVSDEEFQQLTNLLHQNAPQHLIRTKFDYPL